METSGDGNDKIKKTPNNKQNFISEAYPALLSAKQILVSVFQGIN